MLNHIIDRNIREFHYKFMYKFIFFQLLTFTCPTLITGIID